MHSIRKIRRITIGRTWVYIGTGGTHECVPVYGLILTIPTYWFTDEKWSAISQT